MAVIVQRQIAPSWSGFVLLPEPRDPTRLRVDAVAGVAEPLAQGEVEPHSLLLPRRGALVVGDGADAPSQPDLPVALLERLRELATRAHTAIGGPVECEWVARDGDLWLVQARRQPSRPAHGLEPSWLRPGDERLLWRWDDEHNPEPLSPAHESLVAHVRAGPYRMAVFGGYLYAAEDPQPRASIASADEATSGPAAIRETVHQLARQLDTAASQLPEQPEQRLRAAVDAFAAFAERYATRLGALRRASQQRLATFLEQRFERDDPRLVSRLSLGELHAAVRQAQELRDLALQARSDPALARWLRADGDPSSEDTSPLPEPVRSYLQRYGALAPIWDVAVETLAERPQRLRAMVRSIAAAAADPLERLRDQQRTADAELEQLAATATPDDRRRLRQLVREARQARASREDDDLLFARALWLVRRALLRCGEALVQRGVLDCEADVFVVSIERALAALSEPAEAERESLAREVERGRSRWRAQRARVPPQTIRGDDVRWPDPPAEATLRGAGVGGIAEASAALVRDTGAIWERSDLAGRVLVCPTLTPALAAVLPQLAALVTDHGGPSSHAALWAREYGLPAVVGTHHATRTVAEGERLWVDGVRGRVVRVGR